MLAFFILLGHFVTIDAIGIVVSHVYYFLECVCPAVAEIQDWRTKKLSELTRFVKVGSAIYETNIKCKKYLDGYYPDRNMSGCAFIAEM
jgi:hypothetical protein